MHISSAIRASNSSEAWLEDFRATKLPRRRCVLLRRPRFRSPPGVSKRQWFLSGKIQVWIKERKTGSEYSFNIEDDKGYPNLPVLHGNAIPQCHLEGQALFHFLGKVPPHGVKSWHLSIPLHIQQQLLGYILVPQPPTYHWSLISICVFSKPSRFQVPYSLRDGTVS